MDRRGMFRSRSGVPVIKAFGEGSGNSIVPLLRESDKLEDVASLVANVSVEPRPWEEA